jgi:hypothetical protein
MKSLAREWRSGQTVGKPRCSPRLAGKILRFEKNIERLDYERGGANCPRDDDCQLRHVADMCTFIYVRYVVFSLLNKFKITNFFCWNGV